MLLISLKEIRVDNYFSFYELEESFFLDLTELKRKFYAKSRNLHPDFYIQESESKQEEILTLSAYNNDAYNTLKDENARMEYILRMHNILGDEGSNKLDQMFLMEMMDINEGLMELQMDFDQDSYDKVIQQIEDIETALYSEAETSMKSFDQDKDVSRLENVLQYYLKKKYLLRIKDNLDKFVDA